MLYGLLEREVAPEFYARDEQVFPLSGKTGELGKYVLGALTAASSAGLLRPPAKI